MNHKRVLIIGVLLFSTILLSACKQSVGLPYPTLDKISELSTDAPFNMEVVLSDEIVCAGDEVTVQMFTRVLNASPGIQFRNIEIYNNDLDPSIDIRETLFVEESDLNGNGYLDWVDLDGTDYIAPNGDLRSDEEFLHQYTRVFTQTTAIVAGDQADIYIVDDIMNPTSVTDLNSTVAAEDSATVTVLSPELSIVVEAADETVMAGEAALFNITFDNIGDVEITNILIRHKQIPSCDGQVASILAGEQYSYTCGVDEANEDITLEVSFNADAGDQVCSIESSASSNIAIIQPTPTNTPIPTSTPLPLTVDGCNAILQTPETSISGSGQPNAPFQVMVNDDVVGQSAIDADGAWSYELTFDNVGRQNISVEALDTNGEPTGEIARLRCMVAAPTATPLPTATPTDTPAPTGTPVPLTIDGCGTDVLSSGRITLSGTGMANQTVNILVAGAVIANAQIESDMTWQSVVELPGTRDVQVYAQSIDANGKVTSITRPIVCSVATPTPLPTSTPLPTATLVPTDAPTATSTSTSTPLPPTATPLPPTATPPPAPTAVPLSISGCETALSSSKATLRGSGMPNSMMNIFVDQLNLDTIQVGAGGEWSYQVLFSSPGEYMVYTQATDSNGTSPSVRCVVPEAQAPTYLPVTGFSHNNAARAIWATLLVGMLILMAGFYEGKKSQ